MFETIILTTFALILAVSMALRVPLYITLTIGFFLFCGYGLAKGHKIPALARMSVQGIKAIGPVLQLFVIIGMLTASWRAAGTIAAITCWSSHIISPGSLMLMSFLICAFMSFLIGSSIATVATVGVICMIISSAMGANQVLVGGAVISGVFFGDRSSPLSSTLLLTSTLTHTSLFDNLSRALRVSIVPFIVTALIYIGLGITQSSAGATPDFEALFSPEFKIAWPTLLPTLAIIVLSMRRVNVRKTMLVSLLLALALCIFYQNVPLIDIPGMLLFGYKSPDPYLASMVNGGGILSMGPIAAIVTVASTFSGIFEGTGLLEMLRQRIKRLAVSTTPFVGVLATSLLTTVIACDQMLSIMLTKQLCDELEYGGEALALDLANSSAIVSGFIPWSTVCIAILAFLEVPAVSVVFACYTYLIPLWFLVLSIWLHKRPGFVESKFGRAMGLSEVDDSRRFPGYIEKMTLES